VFCYVLGMFVTTVLMENVYYSHFVLSTKMLLGCKNIDKIKELVAHGIILRTLIFSSEAKA
jgi:hypothetical protein